jgi:phosphatidylcholine synthase
MLLVCSLLVFVPLRYVYPSRTVAFRKTTITLTTLWLFSYIAILIQMPDPNSALLTLSLLYLVYYFSLSLYTSSKMLKDRRTARRLA